MPRPNQCKCEHCGSEKASCYKAVASNKSLPPRPSSLKGPVNPRISHPSTPSPVQATFTPSFWHVENLAEEMFNKLPTCLMHDLKDSFRKADQDQDGLLNSIELKTFMNLRQTPISNYCCKKILRLADPRRGKHAEFEKLIKILLSNGASVEVEPANISSNLCSDGTKLVRKPSPYPTISFDRLVNYFECIAEKEEKHRLRDRLPYRPESSFKDCKSDHFKSTSNLVSSNYVPREPEVSCSEEENVIGADETFEDVCQSDSVTSNFIQYVESDESDLLDCDGGCEPDSDCRRSSSSEDAKRVDFSLTKKSLLERRSAISQARPRAFPNETIKSTARFRNPEPETNPEELQRRPFGSYDCKCSPLGREMKPKISSYQRQDCQKDNFEDNARPHTRSIEPSKCQFSPGIRPDCKRYMPSKVEHNNGKPSSKELRCYSKSVNSNQNGTSNGVGLKNSGSQKYTPPPAGSRGSTRRLKNFAAVKDRWESGAMRDYPLSSDSPCDEAPELNLKDTSQSWYNSSNECYEGNRNNDLCGPCVEESGSDQHSDHSDSCQVEGKDSKVEHLNESDSQCEFETDTGEQSTERPPVPPLPKYLATMSVTTSSMCFPPTGQNIARNSQLMDELRQKAFNMRIRVLEKQIRDREIELCKCNKKLEKCAARNKPPLQRISNSALDLKAKQGPNPCATKTRSYVHRS